MFLSRQSFGRKNVRYLLIWFYPLSLKYVNWPPQRVSKVDFSSIDPLSERLEECGLCVVYVKKDGAVLLVGT